MLHPLNPFSGKVPNGQISNGHHFVFDTPDQLKTKGFIEHFEEDNNDTIIEEEYEEDDGVGSSEEDDDEEGKTIIIINLELI